MSARCAPDAPRSSNTAPVFVGQRGRRQPERVQPVPNQTGCRVLRKRQLRSGVQLTGSVDNLIKVSINQEAEFFPAPLQTIPASARSVG